MKIQHIVIIVVIIASISLGLQVASNTKLQSDIKNINSKATEQDIAIQHLTVGLNESLQMSDLKNKTADQDKLIQSLSSELSVSKQIEQENNITITQLQQNTENLDGEIKSLSDRLASLEDKISPPSSMSVNATSIPPSVNPTPAPKFVNTTSIPPTVSTASTPIVIQNKTSVTSQSFSPANLTISMTKPEIKILSVEMTPNPLKVGDNPQFTVTYQNISDKEIFQNLVGCGTVPSLHWEINPPSSVQRQLVPNSGLTCPPMMQNVKPNEVSVASGIGIYDALYQITTAGELNVILQMNLEDATMSGLQATIQFNVNATQ